MCNRCNHWFWCPWQHFEERFLPTWGKVLGKQEILHQRRHVWKFENTSCGTWRNKFYHQSTFICRFLRFHLLISLIHSIATGVQMLSPVPVAGWYQWQTTAPTCGGHVVAQSISWSIDCNIFAHGCFVNSLSVFTWHEGIAGETTCDTSFVGFLATWISLHQVKGQSTDIVDEARHLHWNRHVQWSTPSLCSAWFVLSCA